MIKKTLIILFLVFSGCAHETIHDYCAREADHYASYDECYAERANHKSRAAAFFQGFSNGYNSNRSSQVRCSSTQFGDTTQASCQ